MNRRIATFLGVSSIVGTYFTARCYPINIDHSYLTSLFHKIDHYVTNSSIQRPDSSIILFKMLITMKVIRKDQRLKKYVLGSGFDAQGKYLSQVNYIGFGGLQVGPISYSATQPQQQTFHLGIKSALANILSFSSRKTQDQFQIHLNITPNEQVLKYTPYPLKQNIIQSVKCYQQIQKYLEKPIVNRICVNYDGRTQKLQGREEVEVVNMTRKLQMQTKDIMREVNGKLKEKVKIGFQDRDKRVVSWSQLLQLITTQSL